jgi:hypothetical protein
MNSQLKNGDNVFFVYHNGEIVEGVLAGVGESFIGDPYAYAHVKVSERHICCCIHGS